MKFRGTALLSLLLLGSIAHAQPGGGGGRSLFPWWENQLAQNSNLSDAQRTQIRAIVKEYRNRLVDARAAVEKADGELEDVFSEDTVDQRKGAEAIERLAAARGELTKALSQMSLRMRSVLTLQQWQDLQRREGPGGPGKSLRRRQSGRGPGGTSATSPPPGSISGTPGGSPPPPATKQIP
jgi:Spy/CpxP family protein refolding chaperone